MEEQFAVEKKGTDDLNIKELFYKYVRFLPLILLSVAVSLLGAYIYLRYTTPVYQSSSALLLKDRSNEGGGEDRFSQLFVLDVSISVQNEIELLRSRQLMERVVEALNLNFVYYVIGNVREVPLYKNDAPFAVQALALKDSVNDFTLNFEFAENGTFKLEGSAETYSFGQTFVTPDGSFRLTRNPTISLNQQYKVNWVNTRRRANQLVNNLVVFPKGTTGILSILLEATHPNLAADVLNQLMREYQVATIEDKNETKRQTIAFIDDRLKVVSHELDSVTASLLQYQQVNDMIDPTTQRSTLFGQILSYDQQINQQQVQISVVQMIDEYLRERQNRYTLVPSTLGLSDATLGSMISAYNVAQLDRKALIDANVPPTNLRVQQKEQQIEQLRLNILESLRNLRESYTASLERLRKNTREMQGQVQQLPLKEQNMLEIRKQQEMKQGVYNFLMEKREETAISLAATISNIKVVEEALPILTPVKPNRSTVQLIAIVVGLALPALFIFGLELLNDKVTTRNDIEKVTSAPIVGEVGHAFGSETLVVKPNNRGIVAEQFRIIRSNLQYVLTSIEKPVILVTSSFSGEGKSFVSTNLGAVLSLANKRTIVLEFDIRKPKILSGLNMSKKPGLTNYLLGKLSLEELPVPVPGYPNLFVLPCGPVPPNPAELLLDAKLSELFTWLNQNFDVVVMDTAPVGMVSDAQTLSRFANATLYIIRQGHTLKRQVSLIDELYESQRLPRMSLVLNDVKIRSGYGYYGYGRYGYGYGYGSGYFDEDDKPRTSAMKRWFGWLDMKRWKKKRKAAGV